MRGIVLLLLLGSCGGNGGPTPSPPPPTPTPTPSSGPVKLGVSGHWLTDNGKPLLISSYGNVVTAIPGHNYENDIALSVEKGLPYNRLWHILAHATEEWPWNRLGNGKWNLSEPNKKKYWPLMDEVLRKTAEAGLILEPHVFDRGCGGSQDEYKAYPWHPNNNVNGMNLPLFGSGTPDFYKKVQPNRNLQLDYLEWWLNAVKGYTHVLLEIENENRGDVETTLEWAKSLSQYAKSYAPNVLLSFSTLDDQRWERAMRLNTIDVALIHMNRECRDDYPCIRSLAQKCWTFNKPCIFDEWANGEGNKDRLRQTAWVLATSGANSHIEDARDVANPFVFDLEFRAASIGASGSVRKFVDESGWKFWESEPAGSCMVSSSESVCQFLGDSFVIRAGEVRWYNPREGTFSSWSIHNGGKVNPPDNADWILQGKH